VRNAVSRLCRGGLVAGCLHGGGGAGSIGTGPPSFWLYLGGSALLVGGGALALSDVEASPTGGNEVGPVGVVGLGMMGVGAVAFVAAAVMK